MRSRTLAPTFAAAMLLAGCADSIPLAPKTAEVEMLRLHTRHVSARVGEPVRLQAQALTADGEPVPGAAVRWRVVDPSIARIEEDGTLVPIATGETEVIAEAGDVVASIRVQSFSSTSVSGLTVTPDPVTIAVGANTFLTATVAYENGKTVAVRTSAQWKSLNTAVAAVQKGKVTGVKAGTTKVIATFEGEADTVSVTIGAPVAPTLALAPDSANVAIGASLTLVPSLSDGSAVSSIGTLTWTSSATGVATVSSTGVVKGIAGGKAVITVKGGTTSAEATIVVPAPTPEPEPEPDPTPLPPTTPSAVELPRVRVDVSMPAVTGRTITVAAGQSIQAAVDAAQPGDEIVLQAGVTYTGNVTLKRKSGTGWITIRSSALGSLPAAGQRVTPAHAPLMPRLIASHPTEAAVRTEVQASHYRLIGLEVTAAAGATLGGTLVALGEHSSLIQNTRESQAHTLVLDRMYIHGTPTFDFQRCVALNSAHTAIVDSWISECHGKGKDSQAIGGWNGTGPYRIENNYLEGAGENVMFGGADPKIPNALPEDIEIRRNHFFKPPTWQDVWTVKNLFELKIGRRVLVEGNVFENNWVDGQTGFAVNLKSVNQSGGAPWSETRDVTFRYNVIRNSANGIAIAAKPERHPAASASRFHVAQNLLDRIGTGDFEGGRLFQITEVDDLTLEHNTAFGSHSTIVLVGADPMERFVVRRNLFDRTTYGVSGNGAGFGSAALAARAPGAVFDANIVVGVDAGRYPSNNLYPAAAPTLNLGAIEAALGVSVMGATPRTRIRAGAPGTEAGADLNDLRSMISGVVTPFLIAVP